jgi:hypothetical protein
MRWLSVTAAEYVAGIAERCLQQPGSEWEEAGPVLNNPTFLAFLYRKLSDISSFSSFSSLSS